MKTTTVAIKQSTAVTFGFTAEQKNLIKSVVCKNQNLTDDEMKLFLAYAQKTKLDPITNQIHAVKRKVRRGDGYAEQLTIQTGIDGYRAIAVRHGGLAGIDDPVFDDEENPARGNCNRVPNSGWNKMPIHSHCKVE